MGSFLRSEVPWDDLDDNGDEPDRDVSLILIHTLHPC